jgi:VanZ family protein
LGGRSDVPSVDTPLPLDKAAHFVLYGLLGVLSTLCWKKAGRWPHLLLPIVLALAVGVADEVNQRTVAGRSSDVFDWIADAAGVATGCWLVLKMSRKTTNAN